MPTGDETSITDAHHHLWDLKALHYPWLSGPVVNSKVLGNISALCQNYLASDYLTDCRDLRVLKSVHIQAECDPLQCVDETRWLQTLADSTGYPHGIVAFVNLARDDAQAVVEAHCAHRNMRGVRQLLTWHNDPARRQADRPDYMTDRSWRAGFCLLAKYNLSFDLAIDPSQMGDAAALADAFSDTQIILNHTGMPLDRDETALNLWKAGMKALARRHNVAVKISGLGMFDHAWTPESLRPFIRQTIEIFGPERCMFGSNFPVDRLFSDYRTLVQSFRQAIAEYSKYEQSLLLNDNAVRLYRL